MSNIDKFLNDRRYKDAKTFKFTYSVPYDPDTLPCTIELHKIKGKWEVNLITNHEYYSADKVDYYNQEQEAAYELNKRTKLENGEELYNDPENLKFTNYIYHPDIQEARTWDKRFTDRGMMLKTVYADSQHVYGWSVYKREIPTTPQSRPATSRSRPATPGSPPRTPARRGIDLLSPMTLRNLRELGEEKVHVAYGLPDSETTRIDFHMAKNTQGEGWDVNVLTTHTQPVKGKEPVRVSPDGLHQYQYPIINMNTADQLFNNFVLENSYMLLSSQVDKGRLHHYSPCIIDGIDSPMMCNVSFSDPTTNGPSKCFSNTRIPKLTFVPKQD